MVIQNIFLVLKAQLDAVSPKLLVRNSLASRCATVKDYRCGKDILIGLTAVATRHGLDGDMVSGCKSGVESVSGDTGKHLS